MYKELKLSPEEREKYKKYYFIFHGIEFWTLLLILSLFNYHFIFILIGILFHVILDEIDLYGLNGDMFYKLSQTYVYFSNKKKKRYL